MSEQEMLFQAFTTLLNQLEIAVSEAKKELQSCLKTETGWREIRSPKLVSENDRAIIWLQKRLENVKKKHPDVKYEFIKDGTLVAGLKFSAGDRETEMDVEAPVKWAFEKASARPSDR